jgi:glyoxalase superfamily protein
MYRTSISNVVFDAPFAGDQDRFARTAGAIAEMYAELLALPNRMRAEWAKERGHEPDPGDYVDPVVGPDECDIGITFEWQSAGYEPPRWPDPAFPQQMHVDVSTADLDASERLVLRHGAAKLADNADHRVFADAGGHPFCLRADASTVTPRIRRIVIDGPDPDALASFYTELVGEGDTLQMLAFQHSDAPAPRFPDPKFPEQVHLDLNVDDAAAAHDRLRRLRAPVLFETEYHFVYADPAGHPFCMCV